MSYVTSNKSDPNYSTKNGFLYYGRPGLVLRLRYYRKGVWKLDLGGEKLQQAAGGRVIDLYNEDAVASFIGKLKDLVQENPDLLDDREERQARKERKRQRQAERNQHPTTCESV